MNSGGTHRIKRVLLLSSAEEAATRVINDEFVATLNRQADAVEFAWANYHDIKIDITPKRLHVSLLSSGEALDAFDLVYFKSYLRYQEQAVVITEYLRAQDVPYVGHELNHYIPAYKLSQMARLSRSEIQIPDTLYMSTQQYADRYDDVVARLGTPFIFKDASGRTGDNNYLVKSEEQLRDIVMQSPKLHFIAQRFVANEGDLRVIVLGGRIEMIIERKRLDDTTHLNNTSKGAGSRLIDPADLPSDVQEIALAAARAMGRDVAGVDVMVDHTTGLPYILEVNASPQLGSGAYMDEKVRMTIAYCERLMNAR